MVNLIVRRSILKNKLMVTSLVVLFIVATTLSFTNALVNPQAMDEVETMNEEGNREDFSLVLNPYVKDIVIEDYTVELEDEYNIMIDYTPKYVLLEDEGMDSDKVYVIEKYYESLEINKPILDEGSYPSEGEILISVTSASSLDYVIGDKITLNEVEYTISGLAYFANYSLEVDPIYGKNIITDHDLTQVIYMNATSFNDVVISSKEQYVSKFSGKFDEELTKEERIKRLDELQSSEVIDMPVVLQDGSVLLDEFGETVTEEVETFMMVIDKSLNLSMTAIDSEFSANELFLRIMAYVIILISIMLMIILFNNIFKTQRREIGIVKAEGITFKELAYRYVIVITAVLFVGMIIGIIFASFISQFFIGLFLDYYVFPFDGFKLQYILFGLFEILVVLLIIVVIIYIFSIRKNLIIKPISLIKNVENDENNTKLKFSPTLKFFSFRTKYRINILVRNFSKVLLLTFAVFASSLLLLMGSIMFREVNRLIDSTYDEQLGYEYQLTYSNDYKLENFDDTVGSYYSVEAVDNSKNLNVYGFNSSNEDIFNLENTDKDIIDHSLYDEGIVLSNTAVDDYNLEVGDVLVIINPFDLESEIEIEVVDITNTLFQNSAAIDIGYLNGLFDTKYYNTIYGNGDYAEAMNKDMNASLIETNNFISQIEDSLSIFYGVIIFIAVLSGIVTFVTMGIISSLIVKRNSKVISIMKVLGYTNKEIKNITVSAFKWIVITVYFSTIPLVEKMVQKIIAQATAGSDLVFNIEVDLLTAMYGFSILFIIYLISSNFTYRMIQKIDLSESLKVDE